MRRSFCCPPQAPSDCLPTWQQKFFLLAGTEIIILVIVTVLRKKAGVTGLAGAAAARIGEQSVAMMLPPAQASAWEGSLHSTRPVLSHQHKAIRRTKARAACGLEAAEFRKHASKRLKHKRSSSAHTKCDSDSGGGMRQRASSCVLSQSNNQRRKAIRHRVHVRARQMTTDRVQGYR